MPLARLRGRPLAGSTAAGGEAPAGSAGEREAGDREPSHRSTALRGLRRAPASSAGDRSTALYGLLRTPLARERLPRATQSGGREARRPLERAARAPQASPGARRRGELEPGEATSNPAKRLRRGSGYCNAAPLRASAIREAGASAPVLLGIASPITPLY